MTESEPFEFDKDLPAVDPDDLKRVWELAQRVTAGVRVGQNFGVSKGAISRVCSPGVDAEAVWHRAALLQRLFQSGLLDDWREGNEPAAVVFQVGAVFPMQRLQGLDSEGFVARLRSEKQQ